ncbi:hypothetical protein [Spirochaeta isovalerica]|uniref:Uncharacterized protein n=1 Tax=Spirochaeta isovalerica TaxID=150 RepID=A0A841RD05_9SPIO|nr:hypothetical protein [Spirochaeta isovalerica]MBB6480272.1 hypothetical protein [Spirochaeta isovalerica]
MPHRLFDIDDYLAEDGRGRGEFTLTTHREWARYKTIRGMRGWMRVHVKLERISDLSIKNPERTISDGIGDRNDMALLLVNMIYVISGQKVDLVRIEDDNPKSDFPMYYLYYHDIIYEVFNDRSYRNRAIIEHIPFDSLFGKAEN